MRRPIQLVTVLLVLAASPAVADELALGWNFTNEYESRVLGEEDDVSWQVGPGVRLSGERRRLSYSLEYDPMLEFYGKFEQLNGVRHSLRGTGTWMVDARNRISLTDSFSQTPRLQSFREDVPGVEDVLLDYRDTTVLRNTFSGTWTSNPWPRFGTSVQVSHYLTEYEDPTLTSQSTDSTTLTTSGSYVLTPAHSFGVGFRLQSRNFETGDTLEETTTNTYEVFGSWSWTIDERTSFSFQMGPAFAEDEVGEPTFRQFAQVPRRPGFLADPTTCEDQIRQSAVAGLSLEEIEILEDLLGIDLSDLTLTFAVLDGSCDAIAGQRELSQEEQDELADRTVDIPESLTFGKPQDDSNVNLFFALNFSRRWDRIEFNTSWVRSNSETQSLGSATVVDSFRAAATWNFLPRWRAAGAFRFTRRFTDIDREVLLPIFGGTAVTLDDLPGSGGPVDAFPIVALLPVNQKLELTDDIYSIEFRLSREWGRQSSVFASVQYRIQESQTDAEFFTLRSESDQYTFRLGFNYRFRPIRF